MEYTEDPEKMKTWAPLMMQGRDDKERFLSKKWGRSRRFGFGFVGFEDSFIRIAPSCGGFPRFFDRFFTLRKRLEEDK